MILNQYGRAVKGMGKRTAVIRSRSGSTAVKPQRNTAPCCTTRSWEDGTHLAKGQLLLYPTLNMAGIKDEYFNPGMSREKLYQLTSFVLDVFHPLWYEAKEEVNDEGKRVWFHGFHVLIDDELWNVDLWFFDTETITKAEAYCDGISSAVQKFPVYRERIFRIKDALREKGLYGFYQYSSMDVYRAVLEFGVQDSEELIAKFAKTKTD